MVECRLLLGDSQKVTAKNAIAIHYKTKSDVSKEAHISPLEYFEGATN